jgi:hypothetical protein
VRDYSRTRAEARAAYREGDEDAEEIATPIRRFSLMEVTSGLAEDSREGDDQAVEPRLRDLRGRVKAARAVITTTPSLAETLASDWRKAAWFYARYGITERMLLQRVSVGDPSEETMFPDYFDP